MIPINIIFDDRNPSDYERLLGEFAEQGILEYKFWAAIRDSASVVASINASHKQIIRYAKENNIPEICVAEQDLTFTDKGAWDYFLKNKPKEFDIYLGATYILPVSNKKICGFHLYIISEKYYDSFLSVPDDAHIDTAVCDWGGDFNFCYPFPALQKAGFSFNAKDIVDYNKNLSEEDIWKSI